MRGPAVQIHDYPPSPVTIDGRGRILLSLHVNHPLCPYRPDAVNDPPTTSIKITDPSTTDLDSFSQGKSAQGSARMARGKTTLY